jgi:hypothetical protein
MTACRNYLGIKLEEGIFKDALDQFDVVCQLRHGIVHADGLLPGKNAVQLNIRKYKKPVRIMIGYTQIQEIASVVSTLVMLMNRHLFSEMCKRWAVDWRKRADWDGSQEDVRFQAIWDIFHCASELRGRKGQAKVKRADCLFKLRSTYSV